MCVALNQNQKQCNSESEIRQAKALKNDHRMNFGGARRKVEEIKQSSLTFPSDNLFIQIGKPSLENKQEWFLIPNGVHWILT